MIFFGYKTTSGSILRALCAIGVGLILIIMPNGGSELLVRIIAAIIFAAGLAALTVTLVGKNKNKSSKKSLSLNEVNAGAVVVLGLVLMFFPGLLTKAIVVVIGVVLMILGGIQLMVVGSAMSFLGAGYASLAFSFLAFAGGLLIIFSPFTEAVMSIVAGSFLIYYGITELLYLKKVSTARQEYEIKFTQKSGEEKSISESKFGDNVKDVDFEKVDEQ